jgi:hypothetical protein
MRTDIGPIFQTRLDICTEQLKMEFTVSIFVDPISLSPPPTTGKFFKVCSVTAWAAMDSGTGTTGGGSG